MSTNQHDGTSHVSEPGFGPDPIKVSRTSENDRLDGNQAPATEEQPAERTFGYALGLLRTRHGPRISSARKVLRSAAAEGALAGHTANGQAPDPGPKGAGVVGVARARAAHAAGLRLAAVQEDLHAIDRAMEAIERADDELEDLNDRIETADADVARLARKVEKLTKQQEPPPQRPAPDREDWEQIVGQSVPGYQLHPLTRWAMFASAAVVEAIFTGTYVAGVASIGIEGLPVEVNVNLPWAAGAAVGALIPAVAERAAHAAATAEDDAPWYVRRAPAAAIAVPAALGVGRAAEMAQDDLLSGLLGLAVALLLTALAIMAAAIGFRESVGEEREARREVYEELREEEMVANTPGLSPKAIELEEKQALLDEARTKRDALLRERGALLTRQSDSHNQLTRARTNARAAIAASRLDAEKEGGLAIAAGVTYRLRRDAVMATHQVRRPEAFDVAAWDDEIEDLPQLTHGDLFPDEEPAADEQHVPNEEHDERSQS